MRTGTLLLLCALSAGLTLLAAGPRRALAQPPSAAAVKRGEYVFHAAGGCACHTDVKGGGARLAGGRPLPTPFGTFYSTNITPDEGTGLGRWSEADFLRAMTQGLAPDGTAYFPVFPYTSFTRMSEGDLKDLWAYLRTVPAVKQADRPHRVWPPFGWRPLLPFWRWLNFHPGPFRPQPERPAAWNRGAYLVQAVGHCGECHTPRDLLGGLKSGLRLAGSVDGPEGELAPNITPDPATGIGDWQVPDLVWFLQTGLKPNGDDAQGLMAQLIDQGFKSLTEADQRAIATYLRALPPVRHKVARKR